MELLAVRVPLGASLSGPKPEAFEAEVQASAEALGHYLRGESARLDASGVVPGLVEAADHYLAAYDVAPRFRPARGMLVQSANAASDLAERIFPAMLERTPKERLVWQEYIRYLQRTNDPRLQEELERAKQVLDLPESAQP